MIKTAVLFADLQLQLQILREWLKKMEGKVPKLVLKPKWTIETLGRKTAEFRVLASSPSSTLFFVALVAATIHEKRSSLRILDPTRSTETVTEKLTVGQVLPLFRNSS